MGSSNGGPAFPSSDYASDPRNPGWVGGGMTLRDYFAAAAMMGLLGNAHVKPETDASRFYDWADAMLAERERRTNAPPK